MSAPDVQLIADELAAHLHRPVAINNFALDLIAASAQEGALDRYRVDSIVRRHTPSEVVDLLRRRGFLNRREPFMLEAEALPGLLPRLGVPVIHDGFPIAYIWIVIEVGGSLNPTEYQEVRKASQQLLEVLRPSASPSADDLMTDTRRLQHILDQDEYSAGFAVTSLIDDNILVERDDAIVAVFEITARDSTGSRALRDELGRLHRRAHGSWAKAAIAGVIDSRLTLVAAARTAPQRLQEARRDIDHALKGTGLELRAIGTSVSATWTRGLRKTYDEAALTATIAARSEVLPRDATYAELGAFTILEHIPLTDDVIARISPAAAALQPHPVSVQTVLTLLNNAGDITRTCADLSIHRTTLYYRLDRCAGLLDGALQNGLTRTSLHLGLLLAQLRSVNQTLENTAQSELAPFDGHHT